MSKLFTFQSYFIAAAFVIRVLGSFVNFVVAFNMMKITFQSRNSDFI